MEVFVSSQSLTPVYCLCEEHTEIGVKILDQIKARCKHMLLPHSMMAQRNKRRAHLSETDETNLSSGTFLYPKTVLPRAASTPEIPLEIRSTSQDYTGEEKNANKRKYTRPRSVSFHPDIRLYYAATINDLDEVKMLVESGMADVNATNPAEGATAMHGAAYEGNVECIRYLLENGADVNVQDDDGWTSLHAAVCGEKRKCVEVLLKANCDPFAETIDGLTPFQMAIEMANDKLVKLFVKKFSVMMEDKSVPETFV